MAGRTLDELASGKDATYEIKLQLGPKTYKAFDGCPFPLEAATDEERDVDFIPDYHIFFIEFNKQLSQEDHVDLLDWFAELASGKKKPEGEAASEDPAKDEESAKEAAKEKNALLFPAALSKQQRAAWHALAQNAHLQSHSEGVGASRALRITVAPPKPEAPPRTERPQNSWNVTKMREKAKRIWTWCQEEGGPYLNYSQGEISQILEQGTVMPPDLARLCGKRDMAERLFKAIANRDERRSLALLEKDPSLAWVKEHETGGYALHHASWHGLHAVAALCLDQGQTIHQRDKNRRSALQVAKKAKHDSIVRLLIAKGAADHNAKDALNESNEAPKSSDTKDEIMPGLEPNGVTNPEVVLETQTGDKTEEDTPKYVPARNTNETPETHVPANRSGMTIPPIAPSSQTGSEPKIQDETVQTLVKELQKVTSALAQFNKDTAKFLQLAADRSTQSIEMNNLILVLQENVGSFRP